jgi:hypothetical protein
MGQDDLVLTFFPVALRLLVPCPRRHRDMETPPGGHHTTLHYDPPQTHDEITVPNLSQNLLTIHESEATSRAYLTGR